MSSFVLYALQTCFHEIKFILNITNKQTLSQKSLYPLRLFGSPIKLSEKMKGIRKKSLFGGKLKFFHFSFIIGKEFISKKDN